MMECNVYCDESCHLRNDHNKVMGFGCICVPKSHSREISLALKSLKRQYGCTQELKWSKVSPKNTDFYRSLVDFFFGNTNLSFRALVVENKDSLNHEKYNNGSHDMFYYKMYFDLLRNVVDVRGSGDSFNIYFDIKDTLGTMRLKKLDEVLSSNFQNWPIKPISKLQTVRSNEIEALQLADFLLGAVIYRSRGLKTSEAKFSLVRYIEEKSGYCLTKTTEPWNKKFNLFHFTPRSKGGLSVKTP